MLDEELIRRRLLDGAGNALPVLGTEDQGPEDEQVQRPLQELQSFLFSGSTYNPSMHTLG